MVALSAGRGCGVTCRDECQAGRFLSFEMDDLFQPGTEPAEITGRTSGDPLRLCQRGRSRQLLNQGPRQPDPTIVAPAQLANIYSGDRVGLGRQAGTLDDRQQLADPGIGRPLME